MYTVSLSLLSHFEPPFCRLLKELEALQPVLGDIKQLKEVGNAAAAAAAIMCQHQFVPRWQLDCVLDILPLVSDKKCRLE